MKPASQPRSRSQVRMLVVDVAPTAATWRDARASDLPEMLTSNDVLVLNDAATIPASLFGATQRGDRIELRLAAPPEGSRCAAVIFGEGDYRTPTEQRPRPPRLAIGDELHFGAGTLSAIVERVEPWSDRLVHVRFDAQEEALWAALYRFGHVIQYAHVPDPLALWDVQTAYAARPFAVEAPSAGFALSLSMLGELAARGVSIATLTHAAGLSSTGDPEIDARLPLPERFEIPPRTALLIARARASGGRVIAVGTSVVRALETAARASSSIAPGSGTTELRIGSATERRVVDAILTGMHSPGTSHWQLLRAFAPDDVLHDVDAHATARGYVGHELGDVALIVSPTGLNEARGAARARSSATGPSAPRVTRVRRFRPFARAAT